MSTGDAKGLSRTRAGVVASRGFDRFLLALVSVTLSCMLPAVAAAVELERSGGPYVPTPRIVVDHMLRMGKVGPQDFLVDLGSGDGVIVLTAAREHKAGGFGVDIDANLVANSNAEGLARR